MDYSQAKETYRLQSFNSGTRSRLLWYFGRLKHFDTSSVIYRCLWNQGIQISDKTAVIFFCQLWDWVDSLGVLTKVIPDLCDWQAPVPQETNSAEALKLGPKQLLKLGSSLPSNLFLPTRIRDGRSFITYKPEVTGLKPYLPRQFTFTGGDGEGMKVALKKTTVNWKR